MRVIGVVVDFVRREGLYQGAASDLGETLKRMQLPDQSHQLANELIDFVRDESVKARPGERLPGTTELLDSCFGKLKYLERDQCKSGFTNLLLSLGALLSQTTAQVVRRAMEFGSTKHVLAWCREKLGSSVQAKRMLAYHPG